MIEFDEDHLSPCETLIVAFTGVKLNFPALAFEFHKSLLGTSALFVRDRGQSWYQDDIELTVDRIDAAKRKAGASRLAFLGNSMGGFGALMYGSLCNADRVLAFSTQTAIDPAVTDRLGDTRWKEYQDRIAAFPFGDLNALPPPRDACLVHGSKVALDIAHVDHLSWPFERIVVQGAGHGSAGALRDRGELQALLQQRLL